VVQSFGRWTGLAAAFLMSSLPAVPGVAADDAGSPIVQKLLTIDTRVGPDGLYTRITHGEVLARNDSAAHQLGQMPIAFSEGIEELEILEAYTLKPNGKKLAVDAGAIYAQLQQGASQVPMFDDQKQKVIVFPDVAAGDTVAYTFKKTSKQPLFPGQFMNQAVFQKTFAVAEARETITAPKSLPLHVETHEIGFEQRVSGDDVIYSWHYSAPKAIAEDLSAIAGVDRLPRLFVSSFRDYDEFASAYAARAQAKAAVTPKIQALANEITAGTGDRRQQAKKIYEWVSKHIRYVAVFLGTGGVVPHEAEAVLVNGYGDCKDHTVLFAALLKAKGIESEAVLINLGNSYRLSEPPTLAQLNHAITWLPEFNLYADTTAAVAPFGTLPFEEYGKPVVHAVTTGHALRQTPILPADFTSSRVKAVKRLDAEGKTIEDSTTSATGPFAITLRQDALWIQQQGTDRASHALLQAHGIDGEGKFTFTAPNDLASDYSISSHYESEPRPRYLSGDGFTLNPGMGLLGSPGDGLMGPAFMAKLSDAEPTPCFTGHQVEEVSLRLPAGRHVAKLPQSTEVKNAQLRYTAQWSLAEHTVTVRREFTTTMDQSLCTGDTRKAAAKALAEIREEYRTQIMLAAD
jgi:hypothetical protein